MACSDYANNEFWRALEQWAFQDAVLCPYQSQIGGALFASIVLLGIINIPLYARQGSILGPFVVTLSLSGLAITQATAITQGIVVAVVLFTLGLGPVLMIRRIHNQ